MDKGILVGYIAGRGNIRALILDFKGEKLELSNLTDEERIFRSSKNVRSGTRVPYSVEAKHFTVGQEITFELINGIARKI